MGEFTSWFTENTAQAILIGIGIISLGSFFLIMNYYATKSVVIRTLQKHPKKPISNLQENRIAKIIGKATPISTALSAPLSERKCVYYKVIVQEEKGGKNRAWRTIITDEKSQDFIVESSSGKAIIKMQNYKSYFVEDIKHKSGFLNDPSFKLDKYLEQFGKESSNFMGLNKNMRYKEAIIEVHEKIAVLGFVTYEESENYGFQTSYSRLPVMQSHEKNKLVISDAPRALLDKKR